MKQSEIDRHKNIPLSDSDVMRLVEGKAKILVYSDLQKFNTLDEALGEHAAAFLLYETKKDFGHWTAIFRIMNENGKLTDTVEFFDPYGKFPDTQLEWVPEHFKKISGQDYPQLTYLLYHSPYNLTYNEHKFQKVGDGINTCGRWSALRIAFREMPLKIFNDTFKIGGLISKAVIASGGVYNPDDIVSQLTFHDLEY